MLKLKSPAKINLFLQVMQRRPDGFHDIASLFQAVSLYDILQISLADTDLLQCTEPSLPTGKSNLIWKAADLFRSKTGLKFNLHILLEKHIPMEAGLGGGSSNAATILWGINHLLGHPVTTDQLIEWASEIGSDVAFFLSTGTAYCTGRGEILKPLPSLKKQSLTLFKPGYGLSTPSVYKNLNLSTLKQRNPEIELRKFFEGEPEYYNDLESSAFGVLPELSEIKRLLSQNYSTVLMSGSGTTFFCLGESKSKCSNPPGLNAYEAGFTNRSQQDWY
jgi:4-diphosphocytidyl-2-C-methyl-D-erythritol kinase